MRTLISVAAALISGGFLYACGGGGSPDPVTISVIAASSKPIDGGQSLPVYAKVSGGSGSLDVTWTLSCSACGSMAQTVSASGAANAFEAAPWNPNEPRSGSVTITATSVADPSKSGSLTVTINPSLMSSSPTDVQDSIVGSSFGLSIWPGEFLGATPWGGGTLPMRCAIASGTLPAGLQFDAATNVVSGVPSTIAAPVPVTFACADSAYQPVTTDVTVSIEVLATSESRSSVMLNPRRFHTSTLLNDGSVLIAGGESDRQWLTIWTPRFNTAEIFNPVTAQLTRTGSLSVERVGHTAILLSTGSVLIAGGDNEEVTYNSAELYDPATGVFTPTGSMMSGRTSHSATRLADGRVLVAGGLSDSAQPIVFAPTASAEIYDPSVGSFAPTGAMNVYHVHHAAVLLDDGRVLVTGGFDGKKIVDSAEIFDPTTAVFTLTGSMNSPRSGHTATKLLDGRVLVYDPASGTFALTGNLSFAREFHTASARSDGTVLIIGGAHNQYQNPSIPACTQPIPMCWPVDVWEPTGTIEAFDPVTGTFSVNGALDLAIENHTATMLKNGSVLVAGGEVISRTYVNGSTSCCSYFETLVTTTEIHVVP
jgi:hypothetical protein